MTTLPPVVSCSISNSKFTSKITLLIRIDCEGVYNFRFYKYKKMTAILVPLKSNYFFLRIIEL